MADGSWFYFVHSYFVVPTDRAIVSGESQYGRTFTCAVARDNIFATQFHPEKERRCRTEDLRELHALEPLSGFCVPADPAPSRFPLSRRSRRAPRPSHDIRMLLIPAIDLKDGRCVRLRQGDMNSATVFSEDPVAMARHWAELGARRLHLVDLNGARSGKPVNEPVIRKIIAELGDDLPVQLGGGLRDLDTIERYIDDGVRTS